MFVCIPSIATTTTTSVATTATVAGATYGEAVPQAPAQVAEGGRAQAAGASPGAGRGARPGAGGRPGVVGAGQEAELPGLVRRPEGALRRLRRRRLAVAHVQRP